jgi:hypothetical protein
MSGERRAPDRTGPARRSAIDIRALLTHREYIKTTAYLLPRRAKIRVLEMMERLRSLRKDRRERAAEGPPSSLPEMTGGELVREINWRIGTLPPADADAVARYIERLCRWRARRSLKRRDGAGPRRTTR